MEQVMNLGAIPWLFMCFALVLGSIFSEEVGARIWRQDFKKQIIFSIMTVAVALGLRAKFAAWAFGLSVILLVLAKSIAWRKHKNAKPAD